MTLLREGLGTVPEWSEFSSLDLPEKCQRLSPSSISKLLSCPEQFRRTYVKAEPETWGGFALSGDVFHTIRHQMWEGRIADKAALEQAFDKLWTEMFTEQAPSIRWGKHTPAGVRASCWGMVEVYWNRCPKLDVIDSETWVEGYLPGVPLRVIGRVDTLERTRGIIDTKTSTRGTSKPYPRWLIQAYIYVALTGRPFEWHVVVTTKGGTSKLWIPDEYPALRLPALPSVVRAGEGYVRAAYDLLTFLWGKYGADQPWPGVGVVSDSCVFCTWRSKCPWTAGT